jgi:hypothetical protein
MTTNQQKPGMFVPALIGGGIAGLLSGIPLINCLCCLWIIGGGITAVYFYNRESSQPMTPGDGAIVGVFAGLIAAVVDFLISIPLAPLSNKFLQRFLDQVAQYAENMPEGWEQIMERGGMEMSGPMMLLDFAISAVVFSLFAALGGIIGVALFKKKASESGASDVPENQTTPQDTDNH